MSSRDLSVLKKVISKINGLTLETAIEVIDRAIAAEAKLAESNEINRQLSEITADVQLLQDRLTVCSAEREQYRVKLAEIEKQEPIYMWQLEDEEGWIECTKEWFYGDMSNGYEKRIVYASPVQQFKQSCAECGAGADDEGLCLYCVKCMFSAQQSPAVSVPDLLTKLRDLRRYENGTGDDTVKLDDVVELLSTPTPPSAEQRGVLADRFKCRKLPDNPISEIMEPNDIVEQPDIEGEIK